MAIRRIDRARGVAAEKLTAEKYRKSGFQIVAQNYRRPDCGEIDIIAKRGAKLYFIETKLGQDFDAAAARLTPQQQQRMHKSAQKFLAEFGYDQGTEIRFDAALVTHDGRFKVLPGGLNIF
ncbi:MAG: YraN family protein [Pseudomonadota bacterium]